MLHIEIMSSKKNYYDNAPIESLWATLKRETLLLSGSFKSRNEAKKIVRQWLMYYNLECPYRALGNLSLWNTRENAWVCEILPC